MTAITQPGANPGGAPADTGTPGTDTPEALRARYEHVKDRIAVAARRAATRPADIVLVAVTKYAAPDQVRSLLSLGHRDFGENRVQNLVQQAAMVEEFFTRQRIAHTVAAARGEIEPVRWHMIGHLQRNKAKKAVEICRLIHSVDSLRLAEEVQQFVARREQRMD